MVRPGRLDSNADFRAETKPAIRYERHQMF
jgi:hypothetical protein